MFQHFSKQIIPCLKNKYPKVIILLETEFQFYIPFFYEFIKSFIFFEAKLLVN